MPKVLRKLANKYDLLNSLDSSSTTTTTTATATTTTTTTTTATTTTSTSASTSTTTTTPPPPPAAAAAATATATLRCPPLSVGFHRLCVLYSSATCRSRVHPLYRCSVCKGIARHALCVH